jgi:mannose-6-phosphate isomerase-like protein (cupin superfamily)
MTQPISVIAKSLVRSGRGPGFRWRKSRVGRVSQNPRYLSWSPATATRVWKRCGRCVALDIPFARLLEPQVNKTQVIRRGEGTKVVAEQANYQAILLAACPPGARRDIYLLLTQPGADRISHPHPPGSVEHIIVTQGRARVGLTSAPEELGEGDYICYPADQACFSGAGAGYAGPADR